MNQLYDNKKFISRNHLNRVRRRDYNSNHLWPNYECYVQHPQVQNFFLLPSFFDKINSLSLNSSHLNNLFYHQDVNDNCIHSQTPQHHTNPQTPINSNIKRSKRKYQEIILEDQQLNDHMLSVFLDFDNV